MSKHTPGPWVILTKEEDKSYIRIRGTTLGYRYKVANVHADSFGYESEKQEALANASLIAASPDLLEALTMVRDADEDCKRDGLPTIPPSARAKIDAAISKAEGKAE